MASATANGIMGTANRLLGTLGSWGTWRELQKVEDIPKIAAGVQGVQEVANLGYMINDLASWVKKRKPPATDTAPKKGDAAAQPETSSDAGTAPRPKNSSTKKKKTKGNEKVSAATDAPDDKGGTKGEGEEGPGKFPRVSALGAMIGLHALEQATGSVVTSGVRMFLPGKPLCTWRNVIVRNSRVTPIKAQAINQLTRGRLLRSTGYYFHEGGRTWNCQSFTVNVKGTPKTLTTISSLSFPYREHIYDRPLTLGQTKDGAPGVDIPPQPPLPIGDDGKIRELPIQHVVDVVRGYKHPEEVPGYIGSTNELENATLFLGGAKRAMCAASWYLVDESERDIAYSRGATTSNNDYSHFYRRTDKDRSPPPSAPGQYSYGNLLFYDQQSQQVVNSTGASVPVGVGNDSQGGISLKELAQKTSDTDYHRYDFGGKKLSYGELTQLIPHSIKDDYGKPRPVILRDMKRNPFNPDAPGVPDAIYNDSERWRVVTDPDKLIEIAKAYQRGDIKKTQNWRPFTAGYPNVPVY